MGKYGEKNVKIDIKNRSGRYGAASRASKIGAITYGATIRRGAVAVPLQTYSRKDPKFRLPKPPLSPTAPQRHGTDLISGRPV
jgi:hypothetical protein